MTARDLQIRLQKDLIELFKDRRYKTPDGKMESVHVFRQNLPKRESEEAEDPFPYITVVLDSGGVKDQMTAHKIAVFFRIGIYDEDLTNQGHASVLEIMETMQQHYEETNTLGPFAFNDDGDGFAWALQNEQSWPYFFGAVGMTWEAHAPPQKGKQVRMKKTIYLGPTIIGVATTSTVFDGTTLPATITEAAQEEPALLSLCVPISSAAKAMQEISNDKGPAAVFYRKALAYAAKRKKKQGN